MAISKIGSKGITDLALTADDLADGTISNDKLVDATIENAKLAGSISNDKLAGSISNDKLAGSISNDKLTNSSVTINGASVSLGGTANAGMFRNIIINGDMSIAQRGNSETGITSAGYFTIDRYKTSINSMGTFTQSQSTDVPSGQGFAKSLKMECTVADASPAAGDYIQLDQRIEGQNLQYLKKGTSNAISLTLSFWVKSSKTGTYIAELQDRDNSRSISKSYTIDTANTWEKKTMTYDGDTSGVLGNDNGDSFRLTLFLGAGTDYTSGTLATSWGTRTDANRAVGQVNLADSNTNDWYITGIQLEAGTTESDFDFLPFDVMHDRCLRYYTTSQGIDDWGDFAASDENAIFGDRLENYSNVPVNHRFPKRMRAQPTVTIYSLVGTSGSCSDTGTAAGSHNSDDAASVGRVSESGIGYLTGVTNDAGDGLAFQYEADAEL